MKISRPQETAFRWFCKFLLIINPLTISVEGAKAEEGFIPKYVEHVEIQLDGKLNESLWNSGALINKWYQLCPNEGQQPAETTEMWLLFDENAVYLGGRLQQKNPQLIISRNLERDGNTDAEDSIGLILDTLNNKKTSYGFIINPKGVRTDIAIFNDGETQDQQNQSAPWNINWNAFWDAATSQDENGWSFEMRIPFSSLRFEPQNGRAIMGLILWRYIASNAEFDIFPPIPNKWRFSPYKPSQALEVSFSGMQTKHPLYIKPYVLGGINQNNVLSDLKLAYSLQNNWKKEIGLDLKYNLLSNIIFDLTLNTDFAQVEADDQLINLTRFSLLVPEKRTFFQEGADLFNLKVARGSETLFNSRKIGIVNGQDIPIIGGLRLTGRMGNWDIGIMDIETGKAEFKNVKMPAENFGVFRLKRQLAAGSFVGGMFASRTDFDGNFNLLMALDSDIRLKKTNYLNMQLAQTIEPGNDSSKSRLASFNLSNRMLRGFNYTFSFYHIGACFRPALSFFFRQGINKETGRLGYSWLPKSSSIFQNHGISLSFEFIQNRVPKKLVFQMNVLSWEFLLRSGTSGAISMTFTKDWLQESFLLQSLKIPPGNYAFNVLAVKFESPPSKSVRVKLQAKVGGYYNGTQVGGAFSPYWVVNNHLTLNIDYNYSHVIVSSGTYTAHIARIRFIYSISRYLSSIAFIQYNTDIKQINTNVRIRYNPAEGVDLYLVYNEGLNTFLERQIPFLPRTRNRSILLKYSYTFAY